jgi:3-isopropylmalate/(R)-2-methylmalate dehydratase small subunit
MFAHRYTNIFGEWAHISDMREAARVAKASKVKGKNFGCGSSREHAPQALMRYGFNGFIGGSFAEIFAGNCTAVGLVCVTLPDGDLTKLMDRIEVDAAQEVTIDIDTRTITYREGTLTAGHRMLDSLTVGSPTTEP